MKHLVRICLAVLALLYAVPAVQADELCDAAMAEGKQKYNEGDYQTAQKLFEFAKNECGDDYPSVQTLIDKCNASSGSQLSTSVRDYSSTTGTENGHAWVDLGLSVKWATCNVGATSPEKYGNYYAWGETEAKSDYSWNTYKYGTYNYNGDYSKLTKYNGTDGRTTLEASDDAAAKNWGDNWRMPTDAEWTELREKCTWTWTINYNGTGVAGYEVKASNGNSIFLPAAGYRHDDVLFDAGSFGCCWSSSLGTDYPGSAWIVRSGSVYVCGIGDDRYWGRSVRPVL